MADVNLDLIIRRIVIAAAMLGITLQMVDGLRRLKKTPKPAAIGHRYAIIIPTIPPDITLGYVSDLPDRGPGLTLFMEAQYALAPHRLVEGGTHHFTVANLHDPSKLAAICRENGLTPVKVDPSGVALLRQEGAQ